jgi:hypothetical protein
VRLARGIVIGGALAAIGLVGCGASASDQVRAKVEQLARATADKDYRALCDRVLAPSLVQHLTSNGIGCEQAMRVALAGVQNPTVSVGKVTVQGSQATAITFSFARGQQASLDAVKLVETGGGWRVSSLGSAVGGGG